MAMHSHAGAWEREKNVPSLLGWRARWWLTLFSYEVSRGYGWSYLRGYEAISVEEYELGR